MGTQHDRVPELPKELVHAHVFAVDGLEHQLMSCGSVLRQINPAEPAFADFLHDIVLLLKFILENKATLKYLNSQKISAEKDRSNYFCPKKRLRSELILR